MFNLIGKLKFYNGRSCSFSSAPNFSLLQLNQFSSTAATAPKLTSEYSNQDPSSLINLENSFSFSPERALKYSINRKCKSRRRPDSIIAFLKKHRFNDSRISTIVRRWPLIFQHDPETSFAPKINYFLFLGFSSTDVVNILTLAPSLLGRSLQDQIIPCVDFLKSYIQPRRDFLVSILRNPRILEANLQGTLLPIVGILREAGVPEYHIGKFLKINSSALLSDPESFRSTVQHVQKLDIVPQKMAFIVAIIVRRELSTSIWKEKIDLYKSWGWSADQLIDAFKKNPRMMMVSKEKISEVHDHLIKKMGCDLSFIVTRPHIFMYSVKEIIAPRCSYYQVLLSKGLIKQGFSFIHMLTCQKWLFLGRYVRPYAKKDPELLKVYNELFSNSTVS